VSLSFTCIGCASGMPHPKLAGSSYLVTSGKQRILLDSGEGLSSALRRLEIDPRGIGTVFISHMHSDHWIGLPLFLQMNYLLKRKERLDIFLPAEAMSGVKKLLNLAYLFPHKLGFEIELHRVTRSLIVEMRGLTVKPHANNHLLGHSDFLKSMRLPNKMESYSYTIESSTTKVVYSADLAGIEDILPILPGTTLLVIDGMHVDLSQLPAVAKECEVKRILLTHLPEDFDFPTVKQQFARLGIRRPQRAREGLTIDLE
jgi:ribonuclease BN (tRNA processing enzyme)